MNEYLRLGDICDLNMGQSPDSHSYNKNGEGLPFFQGNADFGEIYPTTRIWCSAPIKIVEANTLLISVRAPIGALNISKDKSCIGRGLAGIIPNEGFDLRYIYYCLMAKNEELKRKGTGSTFKAISKNALEEIKVKKLTLREQSVCVQLLDKVTSIILHKKQQIDELDTLIKARFVEMFGDLEQNPKGYHTRKLGSLATKISDGVHAKPEYTETGRPFISVVNINTGKISFEGCKFVSEEAYQAMIKSTHPKRGDILYTKVGATYGIPAYVDTDTEFCLYVSVSLIKPRHEEIDSRFLALSMAMPYVKRQADSRIKGIGVPDLHLNQIREFDIICPPRSEQEEFAAFVAQTDKSKVALGYISC